MIRTLNRSAVLIIPKQPFLEWLRFADPESDDLTLENLQAYPNVYLIPECEEDQDVEKQLRRFCTTIFEEQLDAWIVDDTTWPIDRSFDVFTRWFAISFHSEVLDLVETRLDRQLVDPDPLPVE